MLRPFTRVVLLILLLGLGDTGSAEVKARSPMAQARLNFREAVATPAQTKFLPTTMTEVAAGGAHTCAVISGGTAQCWGVNTSGQLGVGDLDNRTKPTTVSGLTSAVSAITAGDTHTCVLTTAEGVLCWGNNVYGQLGVATANFSQMTPLAVTSLASGVRVVDAATHHTCALLLTGGVRCWGFNGSGQLGDGTYSSSNTPVSVAGLASGVSAIAVGGLHTCALTTGGAVKCWGDGASSGSNAPVDMAGLTNGVMALAAGGAHTCVMLGTGGVKCWGNNHAGQLGDGSTTERVTPVDVVGLSSGVVALAAGESHTCALLSGGGVKCWGDNFAGQLGDGTAAFRTTPTDVVGLHSGVSAITGGGGHTCALLSGGGVKCWGSDFAGQLGDEAGLLRSTPLLLPDLATGAQVVAAGFLHSCLLTGGAQPGGVACWGDNQQSQGGGHPHSANPAHTPVFSLRTGVMKLALGFYHTCALTSVGAVQCWGSNAAGQLGIGTHINQGQPITVTGLSSGVSAIVTGGDHTCALTNTGGVKCWGRNRYGQLGDNTTSQRTTPVDVVGLSSGISALAAGWFHTCALTSSGGVQCWGRNNRGQLGDNSTTDQLTPVQVSGLNSGVSVLAANGEHTCALSSSGVKCWGLNSNGQLGDGSLTLRTTPVAVPGLESGVAALGLGGAHSCALTAAGALKCWGWNNDGQLGDGTTLNRLAPVSVSALEANVSAVSAGNRHTCALTNNSQVFCWGSNQAGQVGDIAARQLTPVDVVADTPAAFTCAAVNEIPSTECTALVELYNTTNGATWITRTNWLATTTPCSWYGLVCAAGHVATLALPNNQLSGTLPAALGSLSALQNLELSDNQLTGAIPPTVGSLTNLVRLDLHGNQLTGLIPLEISNLRSLEHLSLGANQLSGPLPTWLDKLPNLVNLLISRNQLTGTIPSALGTLNNLRLLNLSINRLSGSIPPQIGQLTQLVSLAINNAGLSGPIPPELGNLRSLTILTLHSNQLTGAVPGQLGQLTGLKELKLNDNDLSGSLPVSLTALTNIQILQFQNTALCEPQEAAFQNWLASIATVLGSGISCTPASGDVYETDNTCAQAASIATNGTIQTHNFHTQGDQDWVTFPATTGAHYLVRVDVPTNSLANVVLEIYPACAGTLLEQQGHDFTPGVQLEFVAPSNGSFFLKLTNAISTTAGADIRYELAVRQLSAAPTTSALILVAGGIGDNDAVKSNIYQVTDQVRMTFLKNGYHESQIRYLAADPNHAQGTALATVATLQQTITDWAVRQVSSDGALTLYLMDHGDVETFYLDKAQGQWIKPEQLDAWLNVVEAAHPGVKINVIIEACYAGSFISGPQTVSKAGRVIITSTRDDFVAWASARGAIFSDYFLAELERKASLDSSFQRGWAAARAYHTTQTAWLDGDGDGVPNEAADRTIAAQRGFGVSGTLPSDNWPPHIATTTGPAAIDQGQGLLRAEVQDDQSVKHVWAVIYPPGYQEPDRSEALVRDDQNPRVFSAKLLDQGNHQYTVVYPGFTTSGNYHIVLYAEDEQGLTAQPVAFTVTVGEGSRLYLPLITR